MKYLSHVNSLPSTTSNNLKPLELMYNTDI